MSKTYALLDVNHTLLNDNGALNLHIVHSLLHNNILDVYLFTDMTFKTYSVNDRRALISQLQDLGLTVHGVLTTPNLFWSGDQEDLSLIDSWMAKQSLSTKSEEQVDALKQGAVFHKAGKQFAFMISNGDEGADDLLTFLNFNPKVLPKVFLFNHFLENKPADCTRCVIFEDNEDVIKSSITISYARGVNVAAIHVLKEDFQGVTALQKYNDQLRLLIQLSPPIIPGTQAAIDYERASLASEYEWLNTDAQAIQTIQTQYTEKRGLKFFGYSSENSLTLLNILKGDQDGLYKKFRVESFLSNDKNKGKRLYDVLMEQKIRHTPPQQNVNGNKEIWLTHDMIDLINQKYKQKRGYKIFGYSSVESIYVLKELNDKDRSLSWKQDALQDYLDNVKCKGRRLFNIINEVKNMRPIAAAPIPAPSQQKA